LGEGIEVKGSMEGNPVSPSPFDTDLFQAIQKFARENDPDCPVVPLLLPGATDSRFLRERGMTTYDFCPFRMPEKEIFRVHGNDERIAVENLRFGMKMLVEVIKEVAT
jgi:acetylornithine deacetylase/succinyl-diaminopimelate desuccinylase-like protein